MTLPEALKKALRDRVEVVAMHDAAEDSRAGEQDQTSGLDCAHALL